MNIFKKAVAVSCLFFSFIAYHCSASYQIPPAAIGQEVILLRQQPEFCCSNPYLQVEAGLAYSSKYVWRGLTLVNGSVLQPEVSLSQGHFTGMLWGNFDITDVNGNAGEFSDVQIIFDFTDTFTLCRFPVHYSIGIIHYAYPATFDENTTEMYGALSLNTFLSPTFIAYYDFDEVDGLYLSLSLSHHWDNIFCLWNCVKIGVEGYASFGWGSKNFTDFYYGINKGHFIDALFSLALPSNFRCWTITPFISYSVLVESEIRKNNAHENPNFWGGISVDRTF